MIEEAVTVLAVLLGVLAGLFALQAHPLGERIFKVVPLLVFAYFVPTILSNVGLIPLQCPLYDFITDWLLPASLVLLTMSADIPAILKLGRNALVLFLGATASIVIGGPLAYLLLGWAVPKELAGEAWKGLGALSGSWIGGTANFIAIGKSVEASGTILGAMIAIDVVVSNTWSAVLLFCAGREKQLDERIGADRSSLDRLKVKIDSFQQAVARPITLYGLFAILFIAFAATVDAHYLARFLPEEIVLFSGCTWVLKHFAWVAVIATAVGVCVSFTGLRRLEGFGASKIGSLLLYLLVASIGAKADLAEVIKAGPLLLIAVVWLTFHALVLLGIRYWLKAPVFFAAVGSQANIGGSASAAVVAGAFHPSLAPVGALLGVAGYAMGTFAGLLCAKWLDLVARLY